MQTAQPSLFARGDTFLGVCQGIGEDFGFNPDFLRIAFAFAVFLNPPMALAAYLALGLLVAATRWVFPVAKVEAEPAAEVRAEAVEAEAEPEPVALAA